MRLLVHFNTLAVQRIETHAETILVFQPIDCNKKLKRGPGTDGAAFFFSGG